MRRFIPVALLASLAIAGCSSNSDNTGTAGGAGTGGVGSGMNNGRAAVDPLTAAQNELTTSVGDRVFFDTDSSTLTPEDRATLDRQVAWMKRYPQVSLLMEGHCDERGTREYNLALGDRRAQAAKNYLVDHGVQATRVRTISYGKERPAEVGSNEAAWAKNRRAVSVIDKGYAS